MTKIMLVGNSRDDLMQESFLYVACECDKMDETIKTMVSDDIKTAQEEIAATQIKVATIKDAILPYWEVKIKESCIPDYQKDRELAIIKTLENTKPDEFFDAARSAALVSNLPDAYARIAYTVYNQQTDQPEAVKVGAGIMQSMQSMVQSVAQAAGIATTVGSGIANVITSITGNSTKCGIIGGLFNTKACQVKKAAAAQSTAGQQLQQANNSVVTSLQQPVLPQNPVAAVIDETVIKEDKPLSKETTADTPTTGTKIPVIVWVLGAAAVTKMLKLW